MTTGSERGFARKHGFKWSPGVIFVLLFLGVLGYIAVVPANLAPNAMDEASLLAPADQQAASETANDSSNSQDNGVLTSAASSEASRRRDFN